MKQCVKFMKPSPHFSGRDPKLLPNSRLYRLRKMLEVEKLQSFVVTDPLNIYYLSGFFGVTPWERESILIIDQEKAILIVPRLYRQEAEKLKDIEITILPENTRMFEYLLQRLRRYKGKIGFEEGMMVTIEI